MKDIQFTKIDKLKLAGLSIQAVTGVVGASLILTENHPYLTLVVLAIGALSNQIVSFIKGKENENTIENLKNEKG